MRVLDLATIYYIEEKSTCGHSRKDNRMTLGDNRSRPIDGVLWLHRALGLGLSAIHSSSRPHRQFNLDIRPGILLHPTAVFCSLVLQSETKLAVGQHT